ncbi:unnamed protein product [Zymoseptoria tritici ST99CH_3D1]|nr:unnamed protein product [Zymoseptoria tritici ST99CH_3D1]
MDQGPIDAGPSTDGDYDPTGSDYDTERRRSEPKNVGKRLATAANASDARSASLGGLLRTARPEPARSSSRTQNDDNNSVEDGLVQSASHPSSILDPPTYPRVGATASEVAGEVRSEDDDAHLKEDPNEVQQLHDQDARPHRMYKFTLYETNVRYWITGADITDQNFRLLRIDRNSAPGQIALFEDETVYDRRQMHDVLNAIDQGNKPNGGLRMKFSFWGLLGFIRFTEAYYMLIITKRKQVAMIGGHYVYQVEGTELVPLTTGASSSFMRDRNAEEARFLGILNNLDLTKSFYFSYAYDITSSLQRNIIRARQALNDGLKVAANDYNAMFVWNHHLLKPAVQALKHPFDWCLPIIHGFLDQAALDIFGRTVYVTIIGRRSRHFAGARFLKRGVNDMGYVANDVETEQIVAEKLSTSFHAPGPRLFANPNYTSYLHHRGSIPLYWTQDNSGVTPKPGIDINLSDPFYQPAAQHFDNLFERYGCPVYVLNLIKSREKVPRESKLLHEFQGCINYLNQSLPEDKKILYKAYDMSRAAKTRNSDVIGGLEVIAKDILERTGLFHNGEEGLQEPQVQNGIARTNCIDCLDRTNAAQFVIGKHAFAQQLKILGVITKSELAYDTDAVNLFTAMFHDHGDNIAMQYGGSHLVNTMATYRKLSHWQSSSRDMVESFKRYYHNSFLDSQRQEAYNLFLGNYIWAQGAPMLWDLATDYYLHHSDPRAWLQRNRRNYIHWFTPEHLQPRSLPLRLTSSADHPSPEPIAALDDYWRECYRPTTLSSLAKVYSYRMTSTQRYLPERPYGDNKYDFSPFVRRNDPHKHSTSQSSNHLNEAEDEKKPIRKGVKIVDPYEERECERRLASFSPLDPSEKDSQLLPDAPPSTPAIPHPPLDEKHSILRDSRHSHHASISSLSASNPPTNTTNSTTLNNNNSMTNSTFKPADKSIMHLWTLNQFHTQSLNPHVSESEAAEYAHYISHPLHLPLVISNSSEIAPDGGNKNRDLVEYIRKSTVAPLGSAMRATKPHLRAPLLDEEYGFEFLDEEEEDEEDDGVDDEDLRDYEAFLAPRTDALTVTEEDGAKKRYKAYRQWLMRGKSLFKQSKVDPEFSAGV